MSDVEGNDSAAMSHGQAGQALFVANKRGNTLSKINLGSGEEVKRVESCANPHELATSPDGAHVALACYGGTTIDIFATADLSRVKSIDLGDNARPHGIVWHGNGDLYATAEGRKSVFWIRGPVGESAEVFEYSTGKEGSHMLAIAPNGNHAWTTDLGSKTVTLVDLKTRRAPRSVAVGVEPEGISLSPDGKALWVSARGSDTAIELDPQTLDVRNEVKTGRFPLRLAIRPQGDVAVTSDLADGGLTVIDLATAKVLRSIAVSNAEEAEKRLQVTILWSDDGKRIYVAETGTDTVAEVDYASGKVTRRLATGKGGDGMAILN
ncbi:beta-propeller fold lactonase family protein [Pontixanthobacter aquaemixtae]|uniref:beta-propeller fold lactonase family protein n=1 Tax=Pontixanthobacter aquaemixtae TaxID=1958940 RepID=UPI002E261DCC